MTTLFLALLYGSAMLFIFFVAAFILSLYDEEPDWDLTPETEADEYDYSTIDRRIAKAIAHGDRNEI